MLSRIYAKIKSSRIQSVLQYCIATCLETPPTHYLSFQYSFLTGRRCPSKWNQAWPFTRSHSCYRPTDNQLPRYPSGLGVWLEIKGSLVGYPAEKYISFWIVRLFPFLTGRRNPSKWNQAWPFTTIALKIGLCCIAFQTSTVLFLIGIIHQDSIPETRVWSILLIPIDY